MASGVFSNMVYSAFSEVLYLSSYSLKGIVNELGLVFVSSNFMQFMARHMMKRAFRNNCSDAVPVGIRSGCRVKRRFRYNGSNEEPLLFSSAQML